MASRLHAMDMHITFYRLKLTGRLHDSQRLARATFTVSVLGAQTISTDTEIDTQR